MENQMNTITNYPKFKVGNKLRKNDGTMLQLKIIETLGIYDIYNKKIGMVLVKDLSKKDKEQKIVFIDPKILKLMKKEQALFIKENGEYFWIKIQQLLYKQGKLNQQQIDKLNSLGVDKNGNNWLQI